MVSGDTMDLREKAEKRVDAKIRFQENLYKYLITNIVIAIVCFVFLQSFWLLAFVMFFWGIKVLDDFLKAYPLNNYREELIEKELSKMGD